LKQRDRATSRIFPGGDWRPPPGLFQIKQSLFSRRDFLSGTSGDPTGEHQNVTDQITNVKSFPLGTSSPGAEITSDPSATAPRLFIVQIPQNSTKNEKTARRQTNPKREMFGLRLYYKIISNASDYRQGD
jgi:hypothetical protein